MRTEVWGKHLWYSIHLIALSYPADPTNEEKRYYQSFFENLHQVLPCYKCSINYLKHLNQIPVTSSVLENTDTLFRWTIDMHNLVNSDLSKRQWNYDEASRFYRNFEMRSNSGENTGNNKASVARAVLFVLVVAALIIGTLRIMSMYCAMHLKNTALKTL